MLHPPAHLPTDQGAGPDVVVVTASCLIVIVLLHIHHAALHDDWSLVRLVQETGAKRQRWVRYRNTSCVCGGFHMLRKKNISAGVQLTLVKHGKVKPEKKTYSAELTKQLDKLAQQLMLILFEQLPVYICFCARNKSLPFHSI